MKKFHFLVFLSIIFSILFNSCSKNDYQNVGNDEVGFSTDTLRMDTTFANIGSTTKRLKVYNNTTKEINFEQVYIEKGNNSDYRMTVNGTFGNNLTNVSIPAHDSIFILVEYTINANNSNNPFIVEDKIIFKRNNTAKQVVLQGVGRNGNYYLGTQEIGSQGSNIRWTNSKPYVIYGFAVVPENATLTIDAGCGIYFASQNSGLIIDKNATLIVNGTITDPVVFQAARIDTNYTNEVGQWRGIILAEGSINHSIKNTVIKNGRIGLQCGRFYNANLPAKVTLENVQIYNMGLWGIFSTFYNIEATNVVIGNCSNNAVLIEGGLCNFNHCTFANYGSDIRPNANFIISDYTHFQNILSGSLLQTNVNIKNSIIYGSLENEFGIDKGSENSNINSNLDYCIVRLKDDAFTLYQPYFTVNTKRNQSPLFKDINKNIFSLPSNSPANNFSIGNNVSNDVKGFVRGNPADCGAYETD